MVCAQVGLGSALVLFSSLSLHRADVLATTVLQSYIRYESRRKACQFCAIGQSLAARRAILRKTPDQLAEVARAVALLTLWHGPPVYAHRWTSSASVSPPDSTRPCQRP
jgi:hypothetical protein